MLEVYEWNDFIFGVRAMTWFSSCSRLVATGYRTPLPDTSNENAASDANTQKAAAFQSICSKLGILVYCYLHILFSLYVTIVSLPLSSYTGLASHASLQRLDRLCLPGQFAFDIRNSPTQIHITSQHTNCCISYFLGICIVGLFGRTISVND